MVTGYASPVGGALIGGTSPVTFTPAGADVQVDADLVLEWDFDNDGDFDQPAEDITAYMLAVETRQGRDFPSQLTGKAGPGELTVTLLNTAGRFSYFNAASPLNAAPNSLKVGRKIRLRTTEAVGVDPVQLAKDRFLGSGHLVADETGNAWTARTTGVFARQTDSAGVRQAVPGTMAAAGASPVQHIATVDAGQDDLYAQVQWRFVDRSNRAGLVYRYLNASNFGTVYVEVDPTDGGTIRHVSRTAGVDTTTTIAVVEYRPDDFLGVLVDASAATVYLNGVELGAATAHASAANHVGIYAEWYGQRAPALQEFYTWDSLLDEAEGVLFTGDVSSVMPTANVGQPRTVQVKAVGRLERAASLDVSPPNSVGIVPEFPATRPPASPGSTAGLLVGGLLGRAGLLHPPARIDAGDVTLGAVGLEKNKALTSLRAYEEAELGFLHETPEGGIAFHARSARDLEPSAAVFSDDPTVAGQFRYKALEPYDWRGEVINRVEAGLAPRTPLVVAFAGQNTAANDVVIPMPDESNGAEVGDLFLIVVAASIAEPGVQWIIPTGWTEYRRANDQVGKIRIYAKTVEADDIDDDVTFLDTSSPMAAADFVSLNLLVKNFYGDLQQGFVVSDVTGFGAPNSAARAQAGDNNPAAVFPGWAPAPSLVVVVRAGMQTVSAMDVDAPNSDEWYAPYGFHSIFTAKSTVDTAVQAAFLNTNDEIIDPSSFLTGGTGSFNGLEQVETVTIAVRGFAGDPPETSGGQTIVVQDFASQDDHNGVRTHTNAARLFATVSDAEAYGQAVLDEFADDRPIFRLTFDATLAAGYRAQASARRVGDRIGLVADNDTGMGVVGDFFVECVTHRLTDAGKVWQVEWELSPA